LTRRVVLDTNVLCSGLGWPGPSAQILDVVLDGRLVLIASPALLLELLRAGLPQAGRRDLRPRQAG